MSRVLFLLCMLALIVGGVRAQESARINASDAASWSSYTIPGENFSVALPTMPSMVSGKEFRAHLQKERNERARKIEFEPAMKDGKPVSTYMTLEYYFN